VYMEIHKSSHLSPSPTCPPAEAQEKGRYVCVPFSVAVGLPAWSSTSIRVLGLYVQNARARARKHTHTHWKPGESELSLMLHARAHTLTRAHTLAKAHSRTLSRSLSCIHSLNNRKVGNLNFIKPVSDNQTGVFCVSLSLLVLARAHTYTHLFFSFSLLARAKGSRLRIYSILEIEDTRKLQCKRSCPFSLARARACACFLSRVLSLTHIRKSMYACTQMQRGSPHFHKVCSTSSIYLGMMTTPCRLGAV
jgi:hypothetical protein